MDKEEIKDYLKKNLKIKEKITGDLWYSNRYIVLEIEGEEIDRLLIEST